MIVLYSFLALWLFTIVASTVLVSIDRNGGSGNIGILMFGWLWPVLPFIWGYLELKGRY